MNPLDLTAIILDKGLKTKAEILEYSQDHGTEKMQEWVSANQKKLKEFLADAVLLCVPCCVTHEME